jgi:drug/metabolite transporter (DMT)-like permease
VPDPGQTRAYLALTLISTLWGSYPAFAKLALAHFPPYVLVSLRCTLASAFLAVLLFRRGWEEFRELRAADLCTFAFLGFAGLFVPPAAPISASRSAPRPTRHPQAATPVMVALGARFYLKSGCDAASGREWPPRWRASCWSSRAGAGGRSPISSSCRATSSC